MKAAAPALPAKRSNRLAQLAVILILPAVGLCLYLRTGNPDVPDAPLAARLANPGEDMNILIARAEQQLVVNPEDGAGWDVLAPIYYRNRDGSRKPQWHFATRCGYAGQRPCVSAAMPKA